MIVSIVPWIGNWKNLPGFVASPAISVVPIFPPIANIVPICCWKPALELKEGKEIELEPRQGNRIELEPVQGVLYWK